MNECLVTLVASHTIYTILTSAIDMHSACLINTWLHSLRVMLLLDTQVIVDGCWSTIQVLQRLASLPASSQPGSYSRE